MELFARAGLIIFTFYSPAFLLMLFISVKKYKGYSFTSLWMSCLGDTRYESSKLFKYAWLLYGFFFLFFSYGLSKILPDTTYPSFAIPLFYLSSLFTIFASLIPINKNLILHFICTLMVSVSITISYAFLLFPIYTSHFIPKYFIVFNLLLIILSVIFSFSFVTLIRKEGKIPITLFELRKDEKSFLKRNTTIQEWIFILSVILWNFALSFVVLQNL